MGLFGELDVRLRCCGARSLGNAVLAEKFGQSRLDIRSTHDLDQLLLICVPPSRILFPTFSSFLFNEANTRLKMRLAFAGNPTASSTSMSLRRGEECTAKYHTS